MGLPAGLAQTLPGASSGPTARPTPPDGPAPLAPLVPFSLFVLPAPLVLPASLVLPAPLGMYTPPLRAGAVGGLDARPQRWSQEKPTGAAHSGRSGVGGARATAWLVDGEAPMRHGCGASVARMENTESLVALDRSPAGVATLRLQHGKVNALSVEVLTELADRCDELAQDPPRAVVVTGGDRIFAAGADITQMMVDGKVVDEAGVRRVGDAFMRAAAALEAFECPTIASIGGFALGGGCELALACDLRIGSDRAVFGQPEILLGIIPGGGGTQRLPRLIGVSRAKELILTGRQVKADEALTIGLLNRVVAAEELESATMLFAEEFAVGPRVALAVPKRAIDDGIAGTLDDGLALEQDCFVESFASEDAQIGVSSFLEHGPGAAKFVGR